MKAVILAAGRGRRLQPLTSNRPKPIIELLGESIIKRTIISLYSAGIKEIIIVTHYLQNKIKEHLSKLNLPGVSIIYTKQTQLMGTADAFEYTKDYLKQDEFFIGINGDCLYSPNLIYRAVEILKEKKIGLGGKLVEDTHNYGIIKVRDNKPECIIEKPEKGKIEEGYANIGIYILPTEIFQVLEEIKKENRLSKRGEYELTDAINMLIEKYNYETKLLSMTDDDYWYDIGLPWNMLEANQKLLSLHPEKNEGIIEENVYIKGKVIIEKGARIRSGAYIEGPVFIDENADIGPNCYIRKYTYLGKNTRIGNACEVKNSIIYNGTHAGHLSYIGDSIIDVNANLGAGTITANLRLDNKPIKMNIKTRRINTNRRKLGAIIGEGVKTGIGALIMPGIRVFENSWIGAGTVVGEDVESEMIYYVNQNRVQKRKKTDVD